MLYITTRDKTNAFTAPRTLSMDRGPEGGLFVPFRMPELEPCRIEQLAEKSFGQAVADVLNLFFSAGLTGWDVDFAVGRAPVRLIAMNHRIWMAEQWRNQAWDFSWLVEHLTLRLTGTSQTTTDWGRTAVRIAALFGIFAELQRNGALDSGHPIDVAVASGDFSAPMAVWYARRMGLPIGMIICSCNENGAPWDLLNHGQIHTDAIAVDTGLREADYSVPPALERLIFSVLGYEQTQRYCEACRQGRLYSVPRDKVELLRDRLFGAVVSRNRLEDVIRNVYRTNAYILDPYTAIAYGGLQDYRARTGESGNALILSEQAPACYADLVSNALGITPQELQRRINAG